MRERNDFQVISAVVVAGGCNVMVPQNLPKYFDVSNIIFVVRVSFELHRYIPSYGTCIGREDSSYAICKFF